MPEKEPTASESETRFSEDKALTVGEAIKPTLDAAAFYKDKAQEALKAGDDAAYNEAVAVAKEYHEAVDYTVDAAAAQYDFKKAAEDVRAMRTNGDNSEVADRKLDEARMAYVTAIDAAGKKVAAGPEQKAA